ncbi:aminotransferase class I/II-fold pyridoxal phosphate-dependent enzyme [Paenibacillus sp. GCM10012307]|uniref:Aminotransferase n=1 Tax=Paenibacillus roseus TaxID=2798579 RepID=A0A934MX61_9BACL|nr:aminotransferase class I/II-fold pyridoxal phosphate-dependent enzyme [Paenibacillus roseus]MBJ6363852.1 aminotransferase class I/II-fold pyridoxal phosphate-dependent enzyme [Paenibacillus roseus]
MEETSVKTGTTWRSRRLDALGSAIFAEIAGWKAEALRSGKDVIDLGIGSPDRPPSELIRESLGAEVLRPDCYGYPASRGSAAFREKAAEWMNWRFGVKLCPEQEVVALMGSQDGLAHLALAVTDPGDGALVPNPGYPIYAAGLAVAGVEPIYIPLRAENGFLPDLDAITDEEWERARFILLNFPSNPVASVAELPFLEKLVALAKHHHVLVVHDLAYSEMAFDGFRPPSILQVPGALDIAVEFHSLSKSFNMAGCRIGFLAGNREAIAALRDLKANLDYGVFDAVQQAAVAALEADMRQELEPVGPLYERRRNIFVRALAEVGWEVPSPRATMFIWAPLPPVAVSKGWSCRQISREMVMEAGVVVVPGEAFGAEGKGYVRIALVEDESRLLEAARCIGKFLRKLEDEQ